eukprot:1158384-Pelagomonas_calceolata.AAC.2
MHYKVRCCATLVMRSKLRCSASNGCHVVCCECWSPTGLVRIIAWQCADKKRCAADAMHATTRVHNGLNIRAIWSNNVLVLVTLGSSQAISLCQVSTCAEASFLSSRGLLPVRFGLLCKHLNVPFLTKRNCVQFQAFASFHVIVITLDNQPVKPSSSLFSVSHTSSA